MGESNLTLRIPDELKALLVEHSHRSFQTQSDYVLAAISRRISGACLACGRDSGALTIQSPGMSDSFETWLRQQAPTPHRESPPVSIVTQEPAGPRIYTGTFTAEGIHASYVNLHPKEPGHATRNPVDCMTIPRAYVVMWEANQAGAALRARLSIWGYQDMTTLLTPQIPRQPPHRKRILP